MVQKDGDKVAKSVANYIQPDRVRYYRPPEKRIQLSFRVPESLRDHLDGLVRLWKALAEADGKDPKDIDLTYVCEQLLQVGVDGAWADVGQLAGLQGMPTTEEEWARLTKAIAGRAKAKR